LAVDREPLELLIVGYKVLDGSGDAFALNAVDIRSGDFTVEGRVFGEGFEPTTAKWGALGVDGGSEDDVTAFCASFFGESFADLMCELDVEGRSEAGR